MNLRRISPFQPDSGLAEASNIENVFAELLEAKLKISDLKYRDILIARATQDLLYDWDMTDGSIQWSHAISSVFGYTLPDFQTDYDWWGERVHPGDRDRVHREITSCASSATDRFVSEYRFLKQDGSYAVVYERGFMVRDRKGAAIRMVGAMQDNTERSQALTALRQQKADLSAVCSQAMVGIMHRRGDGELLMVNQRFCEILGRTEEELRGLPVEAYTYPDDRRWNNPAQYARIWAGEPLQIEKRYIRPDGTVVWCEVNVTAVETTDGKPRSTISVAQDITERKQAENALRTSEQRLRLLHDATGLADFESDAEGVTIGSQRFFDQLGLPTDKNTIPAREWIKLVHPDDQKRVNEEIQSAIARHDEWFNSEYRIVRADSGETRWIACRTKMDRGSNGELVRTIGAHLDITAQKLVEEALRESEERFRFAADAAGLGVWDYESTSGRCEVSDRFKEMWGIDRDVEASFAAIEQCVHQGDRRSLRAEVENLECSGLRNRFQLALRLHHGSEQAVRWVYVSGWKPARKATDTGRIIMTSRDVTEERTAEERIRWSANHDALTGIANRTLFGERLAQAIQQAEKAKELVGLLVFDIDNFKQINDTLGHSAGDQLLTIFAERLRRAAHSRETVARLGGDEFAVVIPQLKSGKSLIELANSIIADLSKPFEHERRFICGRASVGASLYPRSGATGVELLKNADIALYTAKSAGGSKAVLFEPKLGTEVKRHSAMIQYAREAVLADRIVPHYQPKIDLSSGRVMGFEALLRVRNDQGRLGPPSTISAAFEDFNIAESISDRMTELVIADMQVWLDHDIPFHHVALNAAAAEFRGNDFSERLLERLQKGNVVTKHFQLEVTEGVVLGRGAEHVRRALVALSSSGVKIALDDFGTGYASLRHLKQFPVDIIKIDKSFVRDMETDAGDAAIVQTVVQLGRSLNIEVVAEGIETQSQLARLTALNCAFGQGYFFSKAVPAVRVPALIRRLARTH